jgi:hypothetical protein
MQKGELLKLFLGLQKGELLKLFSELPLGLLPPLLSVDHCIGQAPRVLLSDLSSLAILQTRPYASLRAEASTTMLYHTAVAS